VDGISNAKKYDRIASTYKISKLAKKGRFNHCFIASTSNVYPLFLSPSNLSEIKHTGAKRETNNHKNPDHLNLIPNL